MKSHRHFGSFVAPIVLVATLAACSSADPVGSTISADQRPTAKVAVSDAPTIATPDGASTSSSVPATTTAPAPFEVSVDVAMPALQLDTNLTVAYDDPSTLDPFGTFASCSAFGSLMTTYTVSVARTDAPAASVTVRTDGPVSVPGSYGASIRIEPLAGEPVVATGSLTVDDSLSSGTFVGLDRSGNQSSGSFACTGSTVAPVPPEATDDRGADAIEVLAVLTKGGAERVVGLTVDPDDASACPGANGLNDPVVVSVDGGEESGSMSDFVLSTVPAPSIELTVGGVDYAFAAATTDAEPGATFGTFSGSSGDTAVDGAFRCG